MNVEKDGARESTGKDGVNGETSGRMVLGERQGGWGSWGLRVCGDRGRCE